MFILYNNVSETENTRTINLIIIDNEFSDYDSQLGK